MSIFEFLIGLYNKGIDIVLEDGALKIYSSNESLSDAEKNTLKELKPRITEIFARYGIVSNAEIVSASSQQKRLWLLDNLDPGQATYNIPWSVNLTGYLDIPKLEQAFLELIRRNDVLRTVFGEENGEVYQLVKAQSDFCLNIDDLSSFASDSQNSEVDRISSLERNRSFDLSSDSMVRARLLILGPETYILLLTVHHIAADGWSVRIMVDELSKIYQSSDHSAWDESSYQYADYSDWQNAYQQTEEHHQELNYWLDCLADIPELHSLPSDYPRPAQPSYRGKVYRQHLDSEIQNKLHALASSTGTTLFMAFHAIFSAFLARLSGASDIVLGTAIANREQSETENVIGFFANTLVLRSDVSDDPSMTSLIDRSRGTLLDAYDHQQIPFERLVDELNPNRDISHAPLFQVMLVLQNQEEFNLDLPGLSFEAKIQEYDTAKYDLTLFVEEGSKGLYLNWEYALDLYSESTIVRWSRYLEAFILSVVHSPDTRISRLPMLNGDEAKLVASEWNRVDTDYTYPNCIHELFEQSVAQTPNALALKCGSQELSFAELNQRANKLAHFLMEKGVGPDSIVALHLSRSINVMSAILAVLKAGGAYLPLDSTLPKSRVVDIISDSSTAIVFVDNETQDAITARDDLAIFNVDSESLKDEVGLYSSENISTVTLNLRETNLAYIIYTSGSTGKPKGILQTHRTLLNLVHAQANEKYLSAKKKSLAQASISFDVSIQEYATAWLTGSPLVFTSDTERSDPAALAKCIAQNEVERLFISPAMLHSLIEGESRKESLNCLQEIIVAGEAINLTPSLKSFIGNNNAKLINHYGPSETHVVTHFDISSCFSTGFAPIGKPIANHQLFVLDKKQMLCPIGVPGELYVGGYGLARSYLKNEELDKEKFVELSNQNFDVTIEAKNVFERFYRTGDLVRWLPDGNLEYLGRIDSQVKIRGFRVEITEIENEISSFAYVKECVVQVKEKEGGKYIIAYVVWRDSEGISNEENLSGYLKKSLPNYMLPVAYISIDEIPLTKNGKIDRRGLPDFDFEANKASQYKAPNNQIEEKLCQIWSEILKINRVGVNDNFFALGGHSLLAMRVVAKIRDEFKLELPLKSLFESPTISLLSSRIETSTKTSAIKIEARGSIEAMPLSDAQRRLWLIDTIDPGKFTFNMPRCFELYGDLIVEGLEAALNKVISRHQILRTVYAVKDDEPVQIVKSNARIQLNKVNFSNEDEGLAVKLAMDLADTEATTPFNLTTDLMLRATLIKIKENKHVLLLTTHHIASDGWSMGVLFREINESYAEYCFGKKATLPALNVQYSDYAHWQLSHFKGDELAEALNYWREQLNNVPPLHRLSLDKKRPAVLSHKGGFVAGKIDNKTTKKLHQLALHSDASLFMVLNAVYALLMHRYSASKEIVVGTSIANREQEEIAHLMGFFVNHIILHSTIEEEMQFVELLAQSRERLLKAYEYQQLPFEKIVDEINPDRQLNYNPIFQVTLVLQSNEEVSLDLQGVRSCVAKETYSAAKYDITLAVQENEFGLNLTWGYATDLFEVQTIEGMARAFEHLVNEIVEAESRPVSEYHLLSESETDKHIAECRVLDVKQKPSKVVPNNTLNQLFENAVLRFPEKHAVIYKDKRLSFAELNSRANQLARLLIEDKGVQVGEKIGLCVERSIDSIVALMAILKSGAAYVPIEPSLPKARIQFLIEDAKLSCILTKNNTLNFLQDTSGIDLIALDDSNCLEKISEKSDSNIDLPDGAELKDRLAYVIYTSGSTGQPKGVLINHSNVIHLYSNLIEKLGTGECIERDPSSTWGLNAPLSFDSSVKGLVALFAGMSLNIVPEDVRTDGEAFARYISNSKLSFLDLTPSHLLLILETLRETNTEIEWPNLVVGGEQFSEELKSKLFDDAMKFKSRVFNVYGPTECTVNSTLEEVTSETLVTIGRPLNNVEAFVLNSKGEVQASGCPGELYIGGAGLAQGYLNREALTEEKFISHPFVNPNESGNKRLYGTGDLVRRRSDGRFEFLGRIDDQVKIRGYRIELGEIQNVIDQLDWVIDVSVLSKKQGDENKICAFVATQAVTDLKDVKDRLLDEIKCQLPEYMLPSSIFVMDELPVNKSGKVDRSALLALVDSSAEKSISRSSQSTTEAGSDEVTVKLTETESILCKLWRELLNLDQIGLDDNFFHLGGHSLMAVRLMSKLKRHGLRLSSRQLFHNPTVRKLAADLDKSKISKPKLNANLRKEQDPNRQIVGKFPILVNDNWVFQRRDYNHWNTSKIWEVIKPYHPNILKNAFSALLDHHDGLRRKWQEENGEWVQVFQKQADMAPWWSIVDLSRYSIEDQDKLLAEEYVKTQTTIDITKALIRIVYFELGDQRPPQLLFVLNHMLVDGFSFGIFMEDYQFLCDELNKCDNELGAEKTKVKALSALPEKTAPISDLAKAYHAHASHTDVTEDELGYWNNIEWDRYKKLPVESEPEKLVPDTGTSEPVLLLDYLSETDTDRFDNITKNSEVTQEDIILTALVLAYGDWSGSRMLGVTLSNHGRNVSFNDEELDLSRTIGCLTHYLFRVFEIGESMSVREALYSIRDQRERLRGNEANYSLLRFMHKDPDVRHQIEYLPTPQLDQNFVPRQKSLRENKAPGFRRATEVMGANCAALNSQFRPFSTVYHCNDTNRLIIQWAYCPSMYTEKTAKALVTANAKYIRLLVDEFYGG